MAVSNGGDDRPRELSAQGAEEPAAGHSAIAPLDLDLTPIDSIDSSAEQTSDRLKNHWLLPGVVALAFLAVAVIWLLPRFTSTQPAAATPKPELVSPVSGPTVPDEGSPWQEAQMERYRKEAQLALENLLKRQQELEAVNVDQWATEEFGQAGELATEGDAQYRRQQFQLASQSYTDSLTILDTLLASIGPRIKTSLDKGLAAVEIFDVPAANGAFEQVLVIDSANAAAAKGLARAAVAERVKAEIDAADAYESAKNFTAALQSLRTAGELDEVRSPILKPRIQALELSLRDQQFTELMSNGYRSLDAGNETAAMNYFAKASQLKPAASEARQALGQVQNQRSLSSMSRHFDLANEHERAENWSAAVAEYQSALGIDANLSDAAQRKAYAEQRHKMDTALETLNADPLRLADATIYQKALKIQAAAKNTDPSGPRLQLQLNTLTRNLAASQTSRSIVVRSDGLTSVTLQRVARLGMIAEKRMQLKPGRYVATGIRDGYRDVRTEFTVPLDEQAVQVEVRCVEPI